MLLEKSVKDIRGGLGLYYVWVYQAYHDITAKYKRTFLGSLWLSGGFVVTSLSLAILFGALFHQKLQQSLPYTMAGILVFGLLAHVFGDGAEMFMASGSVINNHAYPFTFYAFHTTCKTFFLFLHNLVVFLICTVLIGAFSIPHWTILLALPMVLIFIFSWGMLAGMMASRFRDMRFMLPYLGQLFSTLTPLFWRVDGISNPTARMIIELNPFYELVQIVRWPLLGMAPTSTAWTLSLIYTGVGAILWFSCFTLFRRRIPFWV